MGKPSKSVPTRKASQPPGRSRGTSESRMLLSAIEFSAIEFNAAKFTAIELSAIEFNARKSIPIELSAIEFSAIEFKAIEFNAIELSAVSSGPMPVPGSLRPSSSGRMFSTGTEITPTPTSGPGTAGSCTSLGATV